MSKHDYEALGFKAGLEIHQQLAGNKLFCDCPAVVREDKEDFVVRRHLRASSGEGGVVDVAAADEQAKKKLFCYQGYQDSTCLVELDEEPVSSPGLGAVETAVMVAEMLGMTLVDEVHPMRKVVVDGSNTSGFQRTMLVALGGRAVDVRVDRLCLEEDACKIVSRDAGVVTYNLSRLGIPLLEVTTLPDITSPEHLQAIAAHLGMVLRSTRRVLRGLGTIRQDVNISIRDGRRVEIKGVQDLDLMPLIAENEVSRQVGLVALRQKGFVIDDVRPVDISSSVVVDKGWLRQALDGGVAVGVRLPKLFGVLGDELFAEYRLGTELAGFVQSWGFGGIIHDAEESSKYGIASWDGVREALGCAGDDGFFFLVGDPEVTLVVAERALHRLNALFSEGVLSEVRAANSDGTSRYLRPMPGAARMYPETDARVFSLDDVSVEVPELLTVAAARLAKAHGIGEDDAMSLLRLGREEVFRRFAGRLSAAFLLDVLCVKEKELRRRHDVTVDISPLLDELLSRVADGKVSKDAVEDVLLMFAEDGVVSWKQFVPLGDDELLRVVRDVVAADPDAPFGALMGAAMRELGGRADGKRVSAVLREVLQK